MSIDPPYRLDPFQNIIAVNWGVQQPPWWNPGTYDFLPVYYCNYETTGGPNWIYRGWFIGNRYGAPAGGPLPSQEQTQSLGNVATSVDGQVTGQSAKITLTSADLTTDFNFDLSDIYPQYSTTTAPYEYSVPSNGGWDVYLISWRYKWDFGPSDPYIASQDFFSWNGSLGVVVPTRRTAEIVSYSFVRHIG